MSQLNKSTQTKRLRTRIKQDLWLSKSLTREPRARSFYYGNSSQFSNFFINYATCLIELSNDFRRDISVQQSKYFYNHQGFWQTQLRRTHLSSRLAILEKQQSCNITGVGFAQETINIYLQLACKSEANVQTIFLLIVYNYILPPELIKVKKTHRCFSAILTDLTIQMCQIRLKSVFFKQNKKDSEK